MRRRELLKALVAVPAAVVGVRLAPDNPFAGFNDFTCKLEGPPITVEPSLYLTDDTSWYIHDNAPRLLDRWTAEDERQRQAWERWYEETQLP